MLGLSKFRKVHEQNSEYRAVVDTDFYLEEPNVTADSVKVSIPFNIEFEHRSWGVKDVYLNLSEKVSVDYITADDEGKEKSNMVEVDLSQLRQEWYEGSAFTVSSMSLHINKEGKVDYKKSYIELTYIKKD